MNVHFDVVFFNNRFLGIEWNTWKVIGWVGNVVFFSRFLVQWWATEKRKEVVVPNSFWWLSLVGSLLLLAFAIKQKQSRVYLRVRLHLGPVHPKPRHQLSSERGGMPLREL